MPSPSLARQNFTEAAEDALNQQINTELTAGYAYQTIASWCARDTVALNGFARYYGKMAEEERGHAQKFIDYMAKRGGRVVFKSITAPDPEWKSALNIVESALKMERDVNESLLNLHRIAAENEDAQLADFLEGEFLGDQVEDIQKAAELIAQLKRAGTDGLGLYLFDQQLDRMTLSSS